MGTRDIESAGVNHDAAGAQEYDVDDKQHDVPVVCKGQGHFRKGGRNPLLGQNPGENACVHDDEKNHARCLGSGEQCLLKLCQTQLLIDEDSHNQAVNNGNRRCLRRCKKSRINTSQNDDRA